MLKFRIESVIIIIGLCLVLNVLSDEWRERYVFAVSVFDCTSGMGTPSYPCNSANVVGQCDCKVQTNKVTYKNPPVYPGGAGVTITSSTNPVCSELTPCVDDVPEDDAVCNFSYWGWGSAGVCKTGQVGSQCNKKKFGNPTNSTVSSRKDEGCPEN